MKRILVIALAAATLLSLCACGAKEEEAMGATIDFDPAEIEITAPDAVNADENENTIEFEPTVGDIKTPEAVTVAPQEGSNIQIPKFEVSLPTIEPVTVTPNIIEFKPVDIELSVDFPKIEMKNFDTEVFLEDSALNFSEDDLKAMENMDTAQLAKIAEKRAGLLTDLKLAFQSVGLSVQINETTGEIALDAAVLFDVNESTLSDQGKQLLRQFVEAYTYVVFNEKYDGFVEKIMIEGHTDPDGGYDYNRKLSQKRAESVLDYALSSDCGMDAGELKQFKASAEAKGYAYDRPVLDAAGQVDKAASRRVTFCFIINAQ